MRIESEKGVALITALLVLFLCSSLVIGLSWMVMTDQRLGGNYSARESAFYGAEAGMEKMTSDVGTLFTTNGFLTTNNIATIEAAPPTLPGIRSAPHRPAANRRRISSRRAPRAPPPPAADHPQ